MKIVAPNAYATTELHMQYAYIYVYFFPANPVLDLCFALIWIFLLIKST